MNSLFKGLVYFYTKVDSTDAETVVNREKETLQSFFGKELSDVTRGDIVKVVTIIETQFDYRTNPEKDKIPEVCENKVFGRYTPLMLFEALDMLAALHVSKFEEILSPTVMKCDPTPKNASVSIPTSNAFTTRK